MMSSLISLRVSVVIGEELTKLAKSLDRSKTYIIRKAIETYLEEYADYQIALERLRDQKDAILTSAEFKKRLGF